MDAFMGESLAAPRRQMTGGIGMDDAARGLSPLGPDAGLWRQKRPL
jgi:hypothetical protein